MLTVMELARVVYEMRAAQKDYFEKRTRSTLVKALELEAKVDRTILLLSGEVATQGSLFATEAEGRGR